MQHEVMAPNWRLVFLIYVVFLDKCVFIQLWCVVMLVPF